MRSLFSLGTVRLGVSRSQYEKDHIFTINDIAAAFTMANPYLKYGITGLLVYRGPFGDTPLAPAPNRFAYAFPGVAQFEAACPLDRGLNRGLRMGCM